MQLCHESVPLSRPVFSAVARTHRPEIIDQDVEHAQQHDQHNGAQLRLESHNDHDAGHESNQAHEHPPEAPAAREDEANEQENEEYSSPKLDIHLAVVLVHLRQAGKDPLSHPAIR